MLNYIILNKKTEEVQYFENGVLKIKQPIQNIRISIFSHTGELLSSNAYIKFTHENVKEFKLDLGSPLTVESGCLSNEWNIRRLNFFVQDYYIESLDGLNFVSPCGKLTFVPLDSRYEYNFKSSNYPLFIRILHEIEVDSSGFIRVKIDQSDIVKYEQDLNMRYEQWESGLTSRMSSPVFQLRKRTSQDFQ